MAYKLLYRSEKNKMLAGVCGGIGEYLNIDPTVIRLIFVLLSLLTGIIFGLIIYIVLVFIIPTESEAKERMKKEEKKQK